MKTVKKQPFLDTTSAIERARRLEMARNLFVVMRICSSVVLSYLDASFEPRCGRKDLLTAGCCCCCLMLAVAAKMCCSPWILKGGVEPRQGKPISVIKTHDYDRAGS